MCAVLDIMNKSKTYYCELNLPSMILKGDQMAYILVKLPNNFN